MLTKTSCLVLVMCWMVSGIGTSAIPMWEYLSKQEKMSYLYSMFANQVDEFCEKSPMNNCNQELLKYGLTKLKDMPEDHLDVMDPYQRGAHGIIWGSMMEGHEMMKTTSNPRTTTTAKPNSYEDESFGDDYGSQGAASAKIDNVYRVPPPRNFGYTISSGRPQYTYPQNFLYVPTKNAGVYTKFQQQHTTTVAPQVRRYENVPLTGPMVVKVYPDGRPVSEGQQALPQDEDLRQYQMSKVKIPNF